MESCHLHQHHGRLDTALKDPKEESDNHQRGEVDCSSCTSYHGAPAKNIGSKKLGHRELL